ncbi:MAG: alpha-hydroxy-acid oxidizing protein [Candidatus Bathyarchaeota archaeon]
MARPENAVGTIRSVEELRKAAYEIAKATLPPEQVDRNFELTSEADRRSREVLDHICLKQRILHNVEPATDTEIFGQKLKTPVMIAPMARMAEWFEDGVGKMFAATQNTGSMTWIASLSKEFYAKYAQTNPTVFIMKPLADREKVLRELKIAEQTGCVALGIDVDSGGNTGERGGRMKPLSGGELAKIRKNLGSPFVVKGVLSTEDADTAIEAGANAIVVSNHYGTKLDSAQAPLEVLPSIMRHVKTGVEVLVDCQIRKGSDVLKVLALGGKGVLIGRPIVWAAQVGGAQGMTQLLHLITEELRKAMLYTGTKDLKKVPREILVLPKDVFPDKRYGDSLFWGINQKGIAHATEEY